MYKRVCALILSLICLFPLICQGDSHHTPVDEESFFYALYQQVVNTMQYVLTSFVTFFTACPSSEPETDSQLQYVDEAVAVDDVSCADDPDEQQCMDESEEPIFEDEYDSAGAVSLLDEQPLGFTQTDLVQLLEQLQEALGEPEQCLNESCDDASCQDPSCSTVQELLRELEYAPIAYDDTDQTE